MISWFHNFSSVCPSTLSAAREAGRWGGGWWRSPFCADSCRKQGRVHSPWLLHCLCLSRYFLRENCLFSVWMSCTSMHLRVCVSVLVSVWESTGRRGLCYRCNEPGICSQLGPSAWSAGRWSCRGSCRPSLLPEASSARPDPPAPSRDWPASPGATCRSGRADWLPLCAATVEEEEKVSSVGISQMYLLLQ